MHQTKDKSPTRLSREYIPPTFKGEPGERPEAHLLRTLDWFDAIGIATDKSRLKKFQTYFGPFCLHEWFADLWTKKRADLTWNTLTTEFSRYFSNTGKVPYTPAQCLEKFHI